MSTAIQWFSACAQEQRDRVTLTPLAPFSGEQILGNASSLCARGSELFISQHNGMLSMVLVDEKTHTFSPIIELDAEKPYQQLSPFMLGNQLHLLAYNDSDGIFDFFRVMPDHFAHQCRFQKTYGDITAGFSPVHAFAYRDSCQFMAYNKSTGTSRLYQLTVPPNTPLGVDMTWQKEWAKGWENFSFFTLGGENFFFKMNPRYNAVNIDHYMDDPSQGSHPVGTKLPLSMDTTQTATVALQEGPGFIAYETGNGQLTVNRFHTDCQGWTCQAKQAVNAGSSRLLVINSIQGPLIALI